MKGALAYTGAVREDFKKVASAMHFDVPEILADVAVMGLAERSFKSAVLEAPARQLLDRVPPVDAPDDEWLSYLGVLRALRRHLGDDDLIGYAAGVERAVAETHNPALQARIILLASWTLEDHPAAKRSLERKFRELARKYNDAVRGVLPAPKKGWRSKPGRAKGVGD
jgi:hypothetical protein